MAEFPCRSRTALGKVGQIVTSTCFRVSVTIVRLQKLFIFSDILRVEQIIGAF